MAVWLVRRLAASIAIVFTVITLTFFIVHLARGSPCGLGQEHPLPPEVCDSLRQRFGLVLLLVFAQRLRWFPIGGAIDPVLCPRIDSPYCVLNFLWHLALPALTLGLVGAAATARYQRTAMLEVIRQDYVRTARAKGLGERRV